MFGVTLFSFSTQKASVFPTEKNFELVSDKEMFANGWKLSTGF